MSATDSSQPSLEKDGMEIIKEAMESVRLFNLPFRNYAASTKELKRINVTHNLNDEKLKSRILRRLIALQKMLNQQVKILEVFRDQIRKLEKCEQVPISESESCVRAIGDCIGIFQTAKKEARIQESETNTSQPIAPVPVEQAKSINLVPVPIDPEDLMSPCNTLSVRNLPSNVSEGELKALFSQRPGYKRLFFSRISGRKSCSVEFEDEAFAIVALNDLYAWALHNSTEGGIRTSFPKNPFHPATQQSTSKEQVEKMPKRKRDIDELVSSADLNPQKPFKSPFRDANGIPNISRVHGRRNSKIFVSYTISHDCTSNGESESARLLSALRGRPRDNKRNGMKFPP